MQFKLKFTEYSLYDKWDDLKHLNLFFANTGYVYALFLEINVWLLQHEKAANDLQVFAADVGLKPSSWCT